MIRITALNDQNKYANDSQKALLQISTTKEALESEAIALYNEGLSLRKQGQTGQAIEALIDVLKSTFLQEAAVSNSEDAASHSAELLKYSAFRNLAEMSENDGKQNAAMEYYIEAVTVDSSDVSVWYKMGKLAMNINNISLARHAFETGLECNPKHWPCLNNIISLLYVLNNYEACLHYISKALEQDPGYLKGIVFMRKIFSEQPGLRTWSLDFFLKCDRTIYFAEIDEDEAVKYIDDALVMRHRKQELSKSPELPTVTLLQPLTSFTWKCLGECLAALYEHISKSVKDQTNIFDPTQPRLSLACLVDLSLNMIHSSCESLPPNLQCPSPVVSRTVNVSTELLPSTETQEALHPLLEMTGTSFDADQSSLPEGGSRKQRGRRRKNPFFVDEPEYKRRSARVRNPAKASIEEPVSHHQLLYKLLPSALLANPDELRMTTNPTHPFHTTSYGVGDDKSKDEEDGALSVRRLVEEEEEEEVKRFLNEHKSNGCVISLLNDYLIALANSSHLLWPVGLTDVYLKLYRKLRKHITYPNYLSNEETNKRLQDMTKMCLVQKELKLDRWLVNRINFVQTSPRKSPVVGMLTSDFLGKYFKSDMDYLIALCGLSNKLGDFWLEFCIRVSWLEGRFYLMQNNKELAANSFELTSDYLQQQLSTDGSPGSPCLPNCSMDNMISIEKVEEKLNSLRQCQSMEELEQLAESGESGKIIDILLSTIPSSSSSGKDLDVERTKMLLEAIISVKDYKKGLVWAEESFHETLRKYKNAALQLQKDLCKELMIQLLTGINQFLKVDINIVRNVQSQLVVRLTRNVIDLIDVTLDVPENVNKMAIDTIEPWIILYRLIKFYEETDSHSIDKNESLSPSLNLLIMAHEYLGRRSWCMTSEEDLLLFSVQSFMEELDKFSGDEVHPFEEDIDAALEQCFFCLYGHRNKKSKHLEDHNVPPALLTLERCQLLFDYFKPKTLPEYDSYKMNAISSELEILLRRIFPLIIPVDNSVIEAEITAYIDGVTNQPPSLLSVKDVKYPLVKEIYYLLADYYFKNKEQLKAIKFYLYDICLNPDRFDSWAGMALARSSRLENRLTAHELKQESSLQKQAVSTLRCFKRAMQLDDSNVKLWIEYGSCAYQLHSHSSRLIKQSLLSSLSKETLDQATNNKTEMLMISLDCYNRAMACVSESGNKEEKWLIHYMLGKIAEKLDQDPAIYLEHYWKASNYLDDDKAKYPKKISYFSPPHLSVEVLEMFYRTHVCIIKLLMKNEKHLEKIPFDVFDFHVSKAASAPFVVYAEKDRKHEKKSEMLDLKENFCSSQVFSGEVEGVGGAGNWRRDGGGDRKGGVGLSTATASNKIVMSENDHNYSKQNSISANSNVHQSTASFSNPVFSGSVFVRSGSIQSAAVVDTNRSSVVDVILDLSVRHSTEEQSDRNSKPDKKNKQVLMSTLKSEDDESKNKTAQQHFQTCILADEESLAAEVEEHDEAAPATLIKSESMEGSNEPRLIRNDSEALDDLISTLAAVQRSLEVGTTVKSNDKDGVKDGSRTVKIVPVTSQIKNTEKESDGTLSCLDDVPSSAMDTFEIVEKRDGTAIETAEFTTIRPRCLEHETNNSDEINDVKMEIEITSEKTDGGDNSRQKQLHPETSFLNNKYLSVMDSCIKALNLCQMRFPENFKSVYRLAFISFHSLHLKDINRCRDLLLDGNSTNNGLFHDRKLNNFFNGLWRNPVQDLDRWGSFSAHLNRALLLLFKTLVATKDSKILFSLYQQLSRAPIELGKKYLREFDRIQMSQMAFNLCCEAVEAKVNEYKTSSSKPDSEFLFHITHVRQIAMKLQMNSGRLDQLLIQTSQMCSTPEVIDNRRWMLDDVFRLSQSLQLPKFSQFISIHGLDWSSSSSSVRNVIDQRFMTSASNRPIDTTKAPAIRTHDVLQAEALHASQPPVQRLTSQSDRDVRTACSSIVMDTVEIIDLSGDDYAQVINISSPVEFEVEDEEKEEEDKKVTEGDNVGKIQSKSCGKEELSKSHPVKDDDICKMVTVSSSPPKIVVVVTTAISSPPQSQTSGLMSKEALLSTLPKTTLDLLTRTNKRTAPAMTKTDVSTEVLEKVCNTSKTTTVTVHAPVITMSSVAATGAIVTSQSLPTSESTSSDDDDYDDDDDDIDEVIELSSGSAFDSN